ncbi:MAG TPA: hypothetical protein ENM98_02135 [Halothiobacillaceae bacterium]|nr:hypothetical protein [Halothiobacillaceae bacterium]
MNRWIWQGAALLAFTVSSVSAQTLPSKVDSPSGQPLEQTGSGTARYLFWRVYDGALYAPAEADTTKIQQLAVPTTLILTYHRDLSAEDIIKATKATLEKQYPQSEQRVAIDALLEPINLALQPVSAGDAYRLDFQPEPELLMQLSLNDRVIFSSENRDQAQAYFDLWLGEPPLSDSFKRAILGK